MYKLTEKNIAVFGFGKSGKSSIKFLLNNKANVYCWDENKEKRDNLIGELGELAKSEKLHIVDYKNFPWEKITFLILSPGVPLTHPEPHDIVKLAHRYNCTITADIECLYKVNTEAKFIAITGTNGKSTTTALLGHVLTEAGIKNNAGGNLGFPVLEFDILNKDGVHVIETSSYQLDLLHETKFNIAGILNITPDHIKRHGDLEGYIKAKKKAFRNQSGGDFAVVGIDNMNTKALHEEFANENSSSRKVIGFSTQEEVKDGVALIDGTLYNDIDGKNETFNMSDAFLKGRHNDENMACVFAMCYACDMKSAEIVKHIKTFKGLRHRMQLAGQKGSIKFINDSKATNAESTEQALRTYDNVYWILGGQSKEGGIKMLKPYFSKIKQAFLIGAATEEFAETLEESNIPYTKCGDLENAFNKSLELAREKIKDGSEKHLNIMLSPACASWDQWSSFEHRGDYFCELVEKNV